MPIPLLAQLGIALAAGIYQDQRDKAEHKKARGEHARKLQRSIMDRRAARAGDSGYMQQALGGMESAPKKPPSQLGNTLAGVGMALLNRQEQPNGFQDVSQPGLPERVDTWNTDNKGWTGGDLDDLEEKYGNIA